MKDLYTEDYNLSVPSADEWIKKLWCVCIHTHNGIWVSREKEGSPAIYDNTDGPWGYYAKWNKSEKDTY